MTALLSVSKNDTAKVALYVADARRMGVPVEPPDINASEWDFAIEDCAGEAIRDPFWAGGGEKCWSRGSRSACLKAPAGGALYKPE